MKTYKAEVYSAAAGRRVRVQNEDGTERTFRDPSDASFSVRGDARYNDDWLAYRLVIEEAAERRPRFRRLGGRQR